MSKITSHILDTTCGKPAEGIVVELYLENDLISHDISNNDGRVTTLLSHDKSLSLGNYKLKFFTSVYFKARGVESFYPIVEINFNVEEIDQHYHVPLLLASHGYTTYRGS